MNTKKDFIKLGKFDLLQSGYGRGRLKNIVVWEYKGKAYVKNKRLWATSFDMLDNELKGYIPVNKLPTNNFTNDTFYQCSKHEHKYLKKRLFGPARIPAGMNNLPPEANYLSNFE